VEFNGFPRAHTKQENEGDWGRLEENLRAKAKKGEEHAARHISCSGKTEFLTAKGGGDRKGTFLKGRRRPIKAGKGGAIEGKGKKPPESLHPLMKKRRAKPGRGKGGRLEGGRGMDRDRQGLEEAPDKTKERGVRERKGKGGRQQNFDA